MQKLILQVWQEQATQAGFAPELVQAYGTQLSNAVTKGYGKDLFEMDWQTPDYEKLKALHIDAWKFASAKGNKHMQELSDALRKPDGSLRSFEEFRAQSVLITGQQLNGLKAEYNTAVSSAQMASKWQTIQAQKELYPYLQYIAVEDSHTSATCINLADQVHPIDSPFWRKWYPPNHYNCRSTVKQLRQMPKEPNTDYTEPNVPEIFKTNLADSDKIMPDGHTYYQNFSVEVFGKYKRYFPEILQFDIEPLNEQATGLVRVHFLADRKANDFERVLASAKELAKQGHIADVMPKINRKDQLYEVLFKQLIGTKYENSNPDLRLNGSLFIEHEGFETLNAKRALKNMLNRGQTQAPNIIIDKLELTEKFIKQNIRKRIYGEGQLIENVWLLEDGKLKLIFYKTPKASE